MIDHRTLTNVEGVLVSDYQNLLTAGSRGPLLMQEFHLLDTLAHFNQERIPERVVHAKGAVTFGRFTVPLTLASTAKPIGYISERLCQ